jgi:hypothetical protein
VADALLRLITHPAAVPAHVLGEALRAPGVPGAAVRKLLARLGIDRRQTGELRWELDQRLADHHRHGVEVRAVGAKTQALRLERDRAAAAERVVDGRRVLQQIAAHRLRIPFGRRLLAPAPGERAGDVPAGLVQHTLVVAALPRHKTVFVVLALRAADKVVQALTLRGLLLLARKTLGPGGRVVDQLTEQHRPTRRERPPRPPEVQRARMPMPDRLLARARRIDRLQRQRHLDQLFALGHALFGPRFIVCGAMAFLRRRFFRLVASAAGISLVTWYDLPGGAIFLSTASTAVCRPRRKSSCFSSPAISRSR